MSHFANLLQLIPMENRKKQNKSSLAVSKIQRALPWVGGVMLIIYCLILIKIMVFKDIPTIKIGGLMLNFVGTEAGHPANFIPFKTILPYLFGDKGLIIAGINLVGNIALLVPIGFLVPLVYSKMTWKKSLLLAVAPGLVIEAMQVLLHVGIFDIDDVILNGLGVMIGYGIFKIVKKIVCSSRILGMTRSSSNEMTG